MLLFRVIVAFVLPSNTIAGMVSFCVQELLLYDTNLQLFSSINSMGERPGWWTQGRKPTGRELELGDSWFPFLGLFKKRFILDFFF